MNHFHDALDTVLTTQPLLTASLAAMGLASIFYLVWQIVKPLAGFIVSSNSHMLVFWCTVLIVTGFTLLGVGLDARNNAFIGSGASSGAVGIIVLVLYWARKWIKWNYNEREDYK